MVMRNRILAITRGSIPYVPELRAIAGSVTATILMQQLDYWFERYPDGFYKFQGASPDHPAYKVGDSWMEELDFSVAELRNAFDQIGHRHKSKTEWSESDDPFQDKFYCCYTDRRTQLTYYFRNHAKVDRALDSLIAKNAQPAPPGAGPTKAPIHTKSAGKPVDLQQKTTGFAGDVQSVSTGNAQTQFPGNVEYEGPRTAQSEAPMNAQTPLAWTGNVDSPETQEVHSAYTETTGLQKTTQGLQQQPPATPGTTTTLVGDEKRCGSGSEEIVSLIYPQAQAMEIDILRSLVAKCRPENRQAILDEVEGARQRGSLRSGIVPFARALAKAEADDAFIPSLGIPISINRQQAIANAQQLQASKAASDCAVDAALAEHQWTEAELALLPPKMRERMIAKLGQGRNQPNRPHH